MQSGRMAAQAVDAWSPVTIRPEVCLPLSLQPPNDEIEKGCGVLQSGP